MRDGISIYVRLLIQLLSVFLSTRMLLVSLGENGFGLLSVLLGLIAISSVVLNALGLALQRQFSYHIGKGDKEAIEIDFTLGILISALSTILISIFAYQYITMGLIPFMELGDVKVDNLHVAIRNLFVANIIFSISIPFTSAIIAEGNVKWFSILGLLDSVLKLVAAILVSFVSNDQLYYYSALLVFLASISTILSIYIVQKISETYRLTPILMSRSILWKLTSWNIIGIIAGSLNTHGNNLLINLFFGTDSNANRAISTQINSVFQLLGNQIFVIFRPRIIRSFAQSRESLNDEFFLATRVSHYLAFLFLVPIYLFLEDWLNIWLPRVSMETVLFTKLAILNAMLMNLHNSITTVVHAEGKVGKYTMQVELVLMLSFPLTYLFYKFGYPVVTTFYITLLLLIASHGIRINVVLKILKDISLIDYINKFMRRAAVIFIAFLLVGEIKFQIYDESLSLMPLVFTSLIAFILATFTIYRFGMYSDERVIIISEIRKRFQR